MISTDGQHEDQIAALLQLPPDFPLADLHQVASDLRAAEVLVPGYLPSSDSLYDPHVYVFDRRVNEVEFIIFPDRNIASRIASVGGGNELDSSRRIAASLMGFAQCLDINFDPAIAFHELAHHSGNAVAMLELQLFRAADIPRPQEWLDVALGRSQRLIAGKYPSLAEIDLAKPLRRWNRNYIVALKVAELELQESSALNKVVQLMQWMFADFIWAGPALLFASLYFAPSAPRKRMLKHLRSPMRGRAIAGIKNAAWDMTHVSEFLRHVYDERDSKKRFLLATCDKTLVRLGPALLYGTEVDDDRCGAVANRLSSWWPETSAVQISGAFWSYQDRLSEPGRQRNREVPSEFLRHLIRKGEELIMQWRSTP